jgi:hypothetical protein
MEKEVFIEIKKDVQLLKKQTIKDLKKANPKV